MSIRHRILVFPRLISGISLDPIVLLRIGLNGSMIVMPLLLWLIWLTWQVSKMQSIGIVCSLGFHRTTSIFLPGSELMGLLISNLGEILSSRKHSDKSTSLPVIIYSRQAYKKSDKRAIDPTEISWSDEMGDTPVFYNPYLDLAAPETIRMEAAPGGSCDIRPIGWILEQLTGQKVVCCLNLFTPRCDSIAATYIYLQVYLRNFKSGTPRIRRYGLLTPNSKE